MKMRTSVSIRYIRKNLASLEGYERYEDTSKDICP